MNVADRVKQNATATSDTVYVLGGAAEPDFRTFATGFNFPTTGAHGGTLDYDNVPILVESGNDWQIITATVRRDGAGVVSIPSGTFRESSTGSALGLTGAAAVVLSVVPSYWQANLAEFGTRTPATASERFIRRPTLGSDALMALGPRTNVFEKHATAQGYNAFVTLPYEDAIGCGNWPDAGGGVGMRSTIIWQAHTTNATAEKMACYDEDGLIASSDFYTMDTGLHVFRGELTAIDMANYNSKVWDVSFNVLNDGTNPPAAVGTTTFTEIYEHANATAWTPALVVTNAPDRFSVEVTGEAAKNICWLLTGTVHQHITY